MSKQKLNKLISVLLALAICSATVFGCLITVNAAEDPSCTIATGVVSGDSKTATVDVTFTAPGGISAGEFAVDANEKYFTGVTAKVIAGTPLNAATDGAFNAADFKITHTVDLEGETALEGALEAILFETKKVITDTDKDGNEIGHLKPYTSVTFQLTYTLVDGAVVKGTDIPVSISDIVITDQNGGQINISATTAGTIETGCDHIITVSGSPIRTDAENGYAVYENGVCSIRGENFGYQVVPTAETQTKTRIEYWDGKTYTQPTDDDGDNVYTINNAANLAYIAQNANSDTTGKTYKVADDIKAIVLQPEGEIADAIMNLSSATEVKAYFEKNKSSLVSWVKRGRNTANGFAGTFDGNGATIYGLYHNNDWGNITGLFPGAVSMTVQNVAIKNSYVYGDDAAVLCGCSTATGRFIVNDCEVANNVVITNRSKNITGYCGALTGYCTDSRITVYGCLVYGNSVTSEKYPNNPTYTLCGRLKSEWNETEYNNFTDSIILDIAPYIIAEGNSLNAKYTNMYSNMKLGEFVYEDLTTENSTDTTLKYTVTCEEIDGKVKITLVKTTGDKSGNTYYTNPTLSIPLITASDIKGANANNIISNFDDSWAYTANGYPTPLAAYAGAVSTEASRDFALKAVNLTYEDSGNFSINFHYEPPYAGFAPKLYVAKATENGKFRKLTATSSSEAGKGLSKNAVMYTLTGLSATEIGDTLLATVVDGQNAIKCWGKTEQISIKDYAISVISGEGVYTDGATDAQKQADKDVAAAVINYGKAAEGITNDYTAPTKTRIVYWDGGVEEPTAGEDGVYVIDSAEKLAYIAQNANSDTTGKTYKVADDIKAIVLQPKGSVADAIMNLSSATEVKTHFENEENKKSLYKWLTSEIYKSQGFAGTFDGNGATIYGVYNVGGNSTGLFSGANGITVKNVAIKNSYLAGDAAAVICGRSSSSNSVTVQNCEIANNVVIASRLNGGINFGGLLFGLCTSFQLSVDGCLVYGNIATHTETLSGRIYSITYGLCGNVNKADVSNSIVLGSAPYTVHFSSSNFYDSTYNNVYTDMLDTTISNQDWDNDDVSKYHETTTTVTDGKMNITLKYIYNNDEAHKDNRTYNKTFNQGSFYKISATDVLGANAKTNCPNFDWSTWTYGLTGNYPTFANADINALYDTEGTTLYWDGSTYTEPTTKDAEGNYIIDTAAKLAYLACKTKDNKYETYGKKYKVADGITAIVLQPESLAAIKDKTSAAEVKDFFDKNAGKAKEWNVIGYDGRYPFQGTFDGNGATIYGIYANWASYADWHSDLYAGLFGLVDKGAVIKNVTVKNSYLTSKKGFIGAIFANTAKSTDDANSIWNETENKGTGDVVVENCVSANNYMYAPSTDYTNRNKFGVLLGAANNDYLKMNNCIAYGNDAKTGIVTPDGATFDIPFIGALNDAKVNDRGVNSVTNIITLGATPYNRYDFGWGSYVHHEGSGTGTNCFENVYTDQPVGYFNMYAGVTTKVYTDFASKAMPNLTSVTANDLKGDKGATIVDALNIANGGNTVWYQGNAWGYPGFKEASIMPAANQSAYNALSLKVSDNYGESTSEFGMYGTSLSLKANPYIGFTFAFSGDYKANRKDITVTFETASGIVINTKVANDDGKLNPGWTNKEGAGRYHLYKLTDVPVKDLCKPINVTVSYGGTDYDFGSFSAEGFALDAASAYNQNPCAYYSTRYEAAKALLFYSQMLVAMLVARYGSAA